MPAQPLTPEQKADADRLKDIYEAKKEALGLTQDTLAAHCGWSSQGSVSQYLNGKIPLNLPAAIKLASALHCHVQDFSHQLAKALYLADTPPPPPSLNEPEPPSRVLTMPDPPAVVAVVRLMRAMSDGDRREVLGYVKAVANKTTTTPRKGNSVS